MNLIELITNYNTQKKCLRYLEKVRWNGSPICIYCSSKKITRRKNKLLKGKTKLRTVPLLHCNGCNRDFSVLVGTIFERSKMPLPKWFMLISLMLDAKKSTSAKQLSRHLGISAPTSWYSAMRVRTCMLKQAENLQGIIEADSTFIGGKPRLRYGSPDAPPVITLRGKGTKKPVILSFIERDGQKRAVTKMYDRSPNGEQIQAMFDQYVDVNNTKSLITDEAPEFKRLGKLVPHYTVNHGKKEYVKYDEDANLNINTNSIEGMFGMFKNSIRGNFHHITKKYLPFYLAEFTFKRNNISNPKLTFIQVIQNALATNTCVVRYLPTFNTK